MTHSLDIKLADMRFAGRSEILRAACEFVDYYTKAKAKAPDAIAIAGDLYNEIIRAAKIKGLVSAEARDIAIYYDSIPLYPTECQ